MKKNEKSGASARPGKNVNLKETQHLLSRGDSTPPFAFPLGYSIKIIYLCHFTCTHNTSDFDFSCLISAYIHALKEIAQHICSHRLALESKQIKQIADRFIFSIQERWKGQKGNNH